MSHNHEVDSALMLYMRGRGYRVNASCVAARECVPFAVYTLKDGRSAANVISVHV